MIKCKSAREIDLMRRAGRITAQARQIAGNMVADGVTTQSIDKEVREFIASLGAVPAFLNYNGFPGSICVSVNEQVIHGIPSSRKLREGDLVSLDVGASLEGYIGDCAATYVAGNANDETKRLISVTRQCFYEGLKFATVGYRISDISRAIQKYAEENGYSVVREFVGHGIGSRMHEEPEVPNFVEARRRRADPRLLPGMTLAIEPMINEGGAEIRVLSDGFTVVTADGRNSAHYENTILITEGEPEILTYCEGMP